MNLKEAFRYQNYFEGLLHSANSYIENTSNVTVVTQTHKRASANPELQGEEDEVVIVENEEKLDINHILDFIISILNAKRALSAAITKAKVNAGIDIDGTIAVNRILQEEYTYIRRMANIRPTSRTTTGMGYRINVEGNQVSYRYNIDEVVKIDFNRNKAKGIANMLIRKADENSNEIEKAMIESVVDVSFEMPFDFNEDFQEAFSRFEELCVSKNTD